MHLGWSRRALLGQYKQHAGLSTEFLQQNMAIQAFIGECTLAVTCDVQTDTDPRDKIVYYIITERNNERTNVTLRRFHVTIVAVEKQYFII